MSRARTLAAFAALTFAVGCSEQREVRPHSSAAPSAGPMRVFVVNTPLAYFAERIGGDAVEVSFPAPPDVDPAFWSPDTETIAAYQGADLILRNGAGYAAWIDRATLPEDRLVDTGAALRGRLIAIDDAPTHQHGPAGEHSHAARAFTTWLDPELAGLQAAAVAAAFGELRPAERPAFDERLRALQADLRALDARLAAAARAIGDRPLLFSHPVYQYLIARYGLNARSLHWEPDAVPSEKEWIALDTLLSDFPARWLVWEAKPTRETRERLAGRGVTSVVFDPAANRRPTSDWLVAIQQGAAALEQIAAPE